MACNRSHLVTTIEFPCVDFGYGWYYTSPRRKAVSHMREKYSHRISLVEKIASMAISDDTTDIPGVGHISLVDQGFNVQHVVVCRCGISQTSPSEMAQSVRPSLCCQVVLC